MDGMTSGKICTTCHQDLPFQEFHRCGKGYRRNRCRTCENPYGPIRFKRVQRTNSIWTPDLTARVHEMWKDGFWPKEIAAELGVPRSAVIGKMNREGWVTLDREPKSTTESRLKALEENLKKVLALPVIRMPVRHDQ